MKNTSSYRYLFVLLVLAVVSGCGSGLVPLRGTITFSDDGSPLTMGVILFDDGKTTAKGIIKPDGTYVVGSLKQNDGLAPGLYKISIQAMVADPSGAPQIPQPMMGAGPAMVTAPMPPPPVSLVAPKYNSARTSGLECNVDKSTKTYDIVVERNPFYNP